MPNQVTSPERKEENKMMKHEFDKLAGITTDQKAYERIEFVYMNSNQFNTKQEIAEFYKQHDMNGIEKIFKELLDELSWKEEFKEFVTDLAFFAYEYVDEIKKQFAKDAPTIFKNKTLVKLLREYKIRKLKEQQELAGKMMDFIRYDSMKEYSLSNNCLTNSNHYRTVIADLLLK